MPTLGGLSSPRPHLLLIKPFSCFRPQLKCHFSRPGKIRCYMLFKIFCCTISLSLMGLAKTEVYTKCEFSPSMLASPLESKLLQDKKCVSFAHCQNAHPKHSARPQCPHPLARVPNWGLLRDGYMGGPDCRFCRISLCGPSFQLGNAASLWSSAVIWVSEGRGGPVGRCSYQVRTGGVSPGSRWMAVILFVCLFYFVLFFLEHGKNPGNCSQL